MTEFLVNGEVLGPLDYALRGYPTTDDELSPPQPKGLSEYEPPSLYPLACTICGDWAGDLILRGMTVPEMEAEALAVPNRLCVRHWNAKRWGRLPVNPKGE